MIGAIDESISVKNDKKLISYGLVLGYKSDILFSYDILKRSYQEYYKRSMGHGYPYTELKISNLLRDSFSSGITLSYIIKFFILFLSDSNLDFFH